jgi:hypothetical protein
MRPAHQKAGEEVVEMIARARMPIAGPRRGLTTGTLLPWAGIAGLAATAGCVAWSVRKATRTIVDGSADAVHKLRRSLQLPATDQQAYRIMVGVDIERFGHPQRDDHVRVQLRRDLYEAVTRTLITSGISSARWQASSTGDGLLLLVDPTVETARVLWALLNRLPIELDRHNRLRVAIARLRARVVLHSAYVMFDQYGAVGQQINLLFRLLDAAALRAWLAWIREPSVVAVTEEIYRHVVCQRALGLDPADFEPLLVAVKETRTRAWVYAASRTRIAAGPRTHATAPGWPDADPACHAAGNAASNSDRISA